MREPIDNDPNYQPSIIVGPRGYMARGIGWAVGPYLTEEEAMAAFRAAQEKHREIDSRGYYNARKPRQQGQL